MKIQTIKVSEIKHGELIRPEDAGDLGSLAASLAESGQLVPIMVRPVNGHYETVFGNRRVAAAKKAKVKELVAVVADEKMTRAEVLKSSLIENMCRQDMTGLEKGEVLREYQGLTSKTDAEIGKEVGLSSSRVNELIRVGSQPEAIKRLMKTVRRAGNRSDPQPAIQERDVEKAMSLPVPDRITILTAAAKHGLNSDDIADRVRLAAKAPNPATRKKILTAPKLDQALTEWKIKQAEREKVPAAKGSVRVPGKVVASKGLDEFNAAYRDCLAALRTMQGILPKVRIGAEHKAFFARKLQEVARISTEIAQAIGRKQEG